MKTCLLLLLSILISCSPKQKALEGAEQKNVNEESYYILKLFENELSSEVIEKQLPNCNILSELKKGNLYYSDDQKGLVILERNSKCWRIFIRKTANGFCFDLPFNVEQTAQAGELLKRIPGFLYEHKAEGKRRLDFESRKFKYTYYFENEDLIEVKIESKSNTE